MILKWIKRLLPRQDREKERELQVVKHKASLALQRYSDCSEEIKSLIEKNHFARHLIYDKGGNTEHAHN
ncbi:hypothetical protein MKY95_20935 [Paenibacillus sp. FSL P4-0176]|uniref:hypothetical protein n=1 Tax=Paenibacillus sp. FSL P4-0176 TaxID=2921631 RepID=UPI0030D52575